MQALRLPLTVWERVLRVVGALLFLALAGFALLIWNFERPPIDLGLLAQLRTGMSHAEVEAVLGKPTSRSDREWVYARRMSWPLVQVYFGDDGGVRSWVYDR